MRWPQCHTIIIARIIPSFNFKPFNDLRNLNMHTEERPYLNKLFTLHSLLVSNAVLIKITCLSSPKLGYFSEIAVDPANRHFVENRVSESMKHRWHPNHTYASETSVESRYNAVQFITLLHTALRLKWRKVNHIWESQQTGELWRVYCENFWENWPRYNDTAL